MTATAATVAQPKGDAWHTLYADDVLVRVDSTATELSATEAARRLAANGPNGLTEGKRIGPLQIFLGQFKSLIIWILIVAGGLAGGTGVDTRANQDTESAGEAGKAARISDCRSAIYYATKRGADLRRWPRCGILAG